MDVQCKICKQKINKKNAIKVKERVYCCSNECVEQYTIKTTPVVVVEKKKDDRVLLFDYIQSIYVNNGYNKNSINWAIITKQANNIIKTNPNFTYTNIKYCLYYMYEICGDDLFAQMTGSILDLVPYKYNEAKEFYSKKRKIDKLVQSQSIEVEDKIIVKTKAYQQFDDDDFEDYR